MNFSAKMQEWGNLCVHTCKKAFTYYPTIKQFMRISILVTTIVLITLQLLFAFPGKSQDITVEKVVIGLQQQSLESAIKQIEKQTTLRFFYRKAEIKAFSSMNFPLESRTVERTLYELLQNTSFSFRQIDQSILIELSVVTTSKCPVLSVKTCPTS